MHHYSRRHFTRLALSPEWISRWCVAEHSIWRWQAKHVRRAIVICLSNKLWLLCLSFLVVAAKGQIWHYHYSRMHTFCPEYLTLCWFYSVLSDSTLEWIILILILFTNCTSFADFLLSGWNTKWKMILFELKCIQTMCMQSFTYFSNIIFSWTLIVRHTNICLYKINGIWNDSL